MSSSHSKKTKKKTNRIKIRERERERFFVFSAADFFHSFALFFVLRKDPVKDKILNLLKKQTLRESSKLI
jgi:hypothetical protein